MILHKQSKENKILCYEDQRTNTFNKNSQQICQNEINLQKITIYPCCYEIVYQECLKSKEKNKEKGHNCLFNEQGNKQHNTVNTIPFIDASKSNFELQLKRVKIDKIDKNLPIKIKQSHSLCQLCQTPFKSNKTSQFFYKCLNCSKQFCSKCNQIIHSKGKFMSHHIQTVNIINPQIQKQQYKTIMCQKHNLIRNKVVNNKIICSECIQQGNGKILLQNQPKEEYELSLVQQNLKFSIQYFKEIYHTQANKLSQVKQNFTKIYKNLIQRIQEKYRINMTQIQKIQTSLKGNFDSNIEVIKKMNKQVQLISELNRRQDCGLQRECFNTRAELIQNKLAQIQNTLHQYNTTSIFDYKLPQTQKYQTLFQQLLKGFIITKTKRQQQDGIYTNRGSIKHNLKTSRTQNRPSTYRNTQSKDIRCTSSIKKNQNTSSNKQNNSSFKRQRQSGSMSGSMMKHYSKDKKNIQESDSSLSLINRKSMGKSVSKSSSIQQQSVNSSRNNSTFFKDKPICDIKDLQKAQYQDFNLNLKKLIITKKTQINNQNTNKTIKQTLNSQRPSENTSLQKVNTQNSSMVSLNLHIIKKNPLSKQNEKSTINSGSFLKIFDNNKSKISARKNYLVNSAEDIDSNPDNSRRKSKVDINSSNLRLASPENHSHQLKKIPIKKQLFETSNTPSDTKNIKSTQNFSDLIQNNSSICYKSSISKGETQQKRENLSSKNSNQRNQSLIFNNLIMVSCERSENSQITQFNCESNDTSNNKVQSLRTQEIDISAFMSQQNSQIKAKKEKKKIIQNIQMVKSIKISDKYQENTSNLTKRSSVSKNYSKNQHRNTVVEDNSSSNRMFKDSTNTSRPMSQKNTHITIQSSQNDQNTKQNINQIKKKSDFMQMRERMRKPNYLSTRLGSNLIGKTNQVKK